jgi:hypothetical protein
MAHFAKVENNYVQEVIVVNNQVLLDSAGVEQEAIGAQFCADLFGGEWVQTSYNASMRSKFAALGDIWDGTNFVSPELEEEPTE